MRNSVFLLALGALVGGCKGPAGGFGGIWAVTVSPFVDNDPVETISHNYLGAVEQTDDPTADPWTFSDTTEQSDSVMMAEIFGLDGKGEDEALMVLGGIIYPGHQIEKGTWEFVWDNFEDGSTSQTHMDGYAFTTNTDIHSLTTIAFTIDGSTAEGTIRYEFDTDVQFTETDRWDPADNGVGNTQIPSAFFVFDELGAGLNNTDVSDECSPSPCSLGINSAVTGEAPFTAAWTRYKDAGAFDSVDEAGQPFGTGNVPYYYYP